MRMPHQRVICYLHGTPGHWEGLCMDFDIAVQGRSQEEVDELLREAIATYVEDAMKEDPKTCRRLLRRRAPLWLQVKLAVASRPCLTKPFHHITQPTDT